jgi:hypothetical protein
MSVPLLAQARSVEALGQEALATMPAGLRALPDPDLMIAHGHRRTQRDGWIAPPRLMMPSRSCLEDPDVIGMAGVERQGGQQITSSASIALTDEPWRPLQEGKSRWPAAAHRRPCLDRRESGDASR